ncbi:serine/arginine-rich splicing factor 11 isoform X1 [Kryptolebias marmoratus]|uniref:serine/arginine-rich splicing factor 11 isoform X1 n=1 Tax=Kryptolebias marmoratus TaxID=37003 RepID=UPI0007F902B0|nr:serine/arginine-rich splicing factor 11 isoform X1 [Kryptolebias marmoratus]
MIPGDKTFFFPSAVLVQTQSGEYNFSFTFRVLLKPSGWCAVLRKERREQESRRKLVMTEDAVSAWRGYVACLCLYSLHNVSVFSSSDSPLPVTSRVCFVKFHEPESVGVSQHLTNTVFVDRALIVVPFAEGVIPDESKAMSLLAPANALAGMMPGGGLLPTPNPLATMTATPFGGLGALNIEQMAAMGIVGSNMNQQAISADFLKLMQSMDPKLNPLATGLSLTSALKPDSSNKEIEETMKKVREAQSLILDAIEPGNKKDEKRKRSRSRSRSRRKRSRSRSRHRRSRSRSRRRSHSRTSRSKRRSKSPRRRRTHSQDRSRRSRSRDRRKEEKSKKRSKTPPKSYSSARRSRSISRRHRRSRTASRSPRRKLSRSPSPRRHKKEKKKDKEREKDRDRVRKEDRDRSRDVRERSPSKKKNKDKDKDKERDRERERKSDSEKGDVKVTRDYDEEEQGYDSEKGGGEEDERKSDSDSVTSPKGQEEAEREEVHSSKKSKLNGDDHHQEDMEMSD